MHGRNQLACPLTCATDKSEYCRQNKETGYIETGVVYLNKSEKGDEEDFQHFLQQELINS